MGETCTISPGTTGNETVASSRARGEYGATTVAPVTEQRETAVKFTTTTPPPPPPAPATPKVFTAAPVAKGFAVLRAPIDIPTSLPAVDLSLPPTNLNDFTGIGTPGGRANGLEGATGAATPLNGVFLESEVEKPVAVLPGAAGPVYPETLRTAGIEGQVMAQFVVDSTGRVELSTFTVLDSPHPLFAASVRRALSRMRFLPAEARGARVAQLVQQSFQFTVRRD